MISIGMHAAALLLPLVVMAQTVAGISDLRDPRPSAWVVDQAEVIDAADEAAMNASLTALKAEVGPEIVVVAVHDVRGTPKAFATRLFNTWKLGTAEKNDGVLVLLVVKQRRVEIETGDGMQAVLTASWLSDMQQREMVPLFKAGSLGAGLRSGAAALTARLRLPPGEQDAPDAPGTYRSDGAVASPGSSSSSDPTSASQRPAYSSPSSDPVAVVTETGPSNTDTALVGLGIMGGVGGVGTFLVRRRNRKCKKCGARRNVLSEEADDAHLTAGQRAEEKVGSVDHTIFHCEPCGTFELQSRNILFTFRKHCKKCNHRTATSDTTITQQPTYDSTGTAQVTTTCSFCHHTFSTYRTLSQLTRPSESSSSSSSSSYDSSSSSSSSSSGGSSSGGGAGSSW